MPVNISSVKKYICLNFRRVRTIGDVASYFHVSPETLRRSFQRTEVRPLSRFILEVKLRYVKKQLATTDRYCFEIIYAAGFPREDSASRTFRAVTGMTMQRYRLRSKNARRTHHRRNGERPGKRTGARGCKHPLPSGAGSHRSAPVSG